MFASIRCVSVSCLDASNDMVLTNDARIGLPRVYHGQESPPHERNREYAFLYAYKFPSVQS